MRRETVGAILCLYLCQKVKAGVKYLSEVEMRRGMYERSVYLAMFTSYLQPA
jgi:hypothetical protein